MSTLSRSPILLLAVLAIPSIASAQNAAPATGPNAVTIDVSSDNGGSGDNYGSGANDCSGTPTVFDDEAKDTLWGDSGLDWFLVSLDRSSSNRDDIKDRSSTESQDDVDRWW